MILYELRDGESSVGGLAAGHGLSPRNVSRCFAVLREQVIVDTCRSGTTIHYRLSNPKITQACRIIREILEEPLAGSHRLSVNMKMEKDHGYQISVEESLKV